MMKLELLPNETLLDLFTYFDGTDLLRAFYDLNSRFNLLLYQQCRSYSFQFDRISKRNFDLICQQHLPFIANRVIALYLADYQQTPKQIDLFFSHISTFKDFTRLQSLTIYHLNSYEILLKLLYECQYLSNLIQLAFHSCSFEDSSFDFPYVINTIWSLPKLTRCYIHIRFTDDKLFPIPKVVSSSIESLTILHHHLHWNQMNQLIEYTPRLKYISAHIEPLANQHIKVSMYSTLTKCNLRFYHEWIASNTASIFQSLPNLHYLDIDICSVLINGYQWESIIRNYLPRLKIFRLYMEKYFFSKDNLPKQADDLFDSFRTSFWIDEHQWYVRCFTENKTIYLCTQSNRSHFSNNKFPDSWRSTDPNDNLQKFYNQITSVYNKTLFEKPISSNIYLPNIEYLNIQFPIDDRFWSIVPSLNRLKSVFLSSYNDKYQVQVQTLLDRAPYLQTLSLRLAGPISLHMALFNYTNKSIRRLNLIEFYHHFNENECTQLIRSSLGVQCEVLHIHVLHRESIIQLVNNMPNLRSLIVQCQDDKYSKYFVSNETEDDLHIQWLKERLPSTCLIERDSKEQWLIFIWI